MAKITEVAFELDPDLITSGLKADIHLAEERSPGLHQSGIIRDLENTVIKPGQRRPDIEISDDEMATLNRYRELGMLWEICLETAFKQRQVDGLDPRRYIRQQEVLHDGVYKTIDAIHIPDWRIIEYKLTFRSARRASLDAIESEFWSWFAQLKGNCLAHETRLASLFCFFVNGTYQPPVPMTKRFDIIFTDEELVSNWAMLKNHEAVMRKEGRLDDIKEG